LDNVTFRTDKDLYDKFKIISTIKKEKVQNVLTKFIEKYVTENEKLIGNPEIQEVIQQELPTFFGSTEDWYRYIKKLDKTGYLNIVMRLTFLQNLLLHHKHNKYNDMGFIEFLQENKDFKKTDDFRYLTKSGIYRNVKYNADRYGTTLLGNANDYL
jgi:hypothetical protein